MPKIDLKTGLIKISSHTNRMPCYLSQGAIQKSIKDLLLGKSTYQTCSVPFRSTLVMIPHTHVYFLDWKSFSQHLCPERSDVFTLRLTLTVKQKASTSFLQPCYENFSFERGEQSWLFAREIVETYFHAFLRYVSSQYTPLIDAVSLYQLRRDPCSALPLGTVLAHDIMECLIQILGMQNAGFKMHVEPYEDLLRTLLGIYHPLGLLEDGQTLLVLSR